MIPENPQEAESTVGGPPGQVTVVTPFSTWTVATSAPDGSVVLKSVDWAAVPASASAGKTSIAVLLKQRAPFLFTSKVSVTVDVVAPVDVSDVIRTWTP